METALTLYFWLPLGVIATVGLATVAYVVIEAVRDSDFLELRR